MLFNSLEYAIFLVVVFLLYWALARRDMLRIVFMTVASYVFYAASNPWFLLLLLASTLTDYTAGLQMVSAEAQGRQRKKKAWLIVSLVVNLGLLGVFKYANFFYESAVSVTNAVAGTDYVFQRLQIMLPAGISFYTFQTMSYSIDLYRGRCAPERSFLRFAFFVGYFPQLVAGPIVRAVDFLPQIGRRPFLSRGLVSRALWLIGIGLFKKAIADYLGLNMVDRVFDRVGAFGPLDTMLGLYGYTMQVYLDFSAYSDIAIGSALLFGFHLPDNFDRPYMATSIQDFWRRWHKTLGSWLRDYLYYPLGGSRNGAWATYRNLFVTFILIGLWHGASWTFVVYGSLHATAMSIHRFVRVNIARRKKPKLTAWGWVWRVALTLHFVVLARVLFRSQSFEQAGSMYGLLLHGSWLTDVQRYVDGTGAHSTTLLFVLAGAFLVHWTPRRWVRALGDTFERAPALVQGVWLGVAILLISHIASDAAPFIYFQF